MERDDERRQQLIEDLLAERPPTIFGDMSEDEAELAQTVAFLKAARPGALQPDPEFVDQLRARLFEPATRSREGRTGREEAGSPPETGGGAVAPRAPRPRSRTFTRRGLLSVLAGGTATGLALGGAAGRAAAESDANARVRAAEQKAAEAEHRAHDLVRAESAPYHVPLVGSLGRWVAIAGDNDLAPGDAKQFTQGALIFYLLRDNAGGYSAFSATCTHMGCLLTWKASGRKLLCPCHGSAYDETGEVVSGVARHPLPRIQVRVHDGKVEVWTIEADATESGVPHYTVP